MPKLKEIAKLIRSKNAGPFNLTFDIVFDDPQKYARVKGSGAISKEVISRLYGVPEENVMFFFCDNALAIKASIPRPIFQGDLQDSDMHGGQQYAPLVDIEIS
ncbi:MAG: DUF4387 domain-containing protein [Thermodesulfobacteriota bacterium]|nr:DUF4387 domain-containing protein [Thermodesulfobacteriota bacterium]